MDVTKLFNPKTDPKWKNIYDFSDSFMKDIKYQENKIIIGFFEKSNNKITTIFKIRAPITEIVKQDKRKIEKGIVCNTKSKSYLIEICNKLGIKFNNSSKLNTENICGTLREELQKRELEERNKKSNIKWFYNIWEI